MYTAKLAELTANYSTGISANIKLEIADKEKQTINGIARGLEVGQKLLHKLLQDPRAINMNFVKDRIGTICSQLEFTLRGRFNLLEYNYATLTNRRTPDSEVDFEMMFKPTDIEATIKAAVIESAHNGKSNEQMYVDGVKSIYDILRQRIDNYRKQLTDSFHEFEVSYGALPKDDEIASSDLSSVQEFLNKAMAYELPRIEMLDTKQNFGADVGDKAVDKITYAVVAFYCGSFHEVYQLAGIYFSALNTLQYDVLLQDNTDKDKDMTFPANDDEDTD